MKQLKITYFEDVAKLRIAFNEEFNNFIDKYVDYKNIRDIDLFFFPVILSDHFFVICINIKSKRFDIIDNSLSENTKKQPLLKYGNVPVKLVSKLTELLIYTY